ncbi:hypothetical protein FOE78_23170 [Microlunatus elymi]|uniref:ABC-2 family transporter protein n=1 Tax=Microlunatus elymi TaxID=2596828 RepID=A0A516Q4Q3_9ACTN|nr:hypothetical protein [Microlunatus elymi]QDP98419.1 hypothetical protein FOE78_23170 [Microlunatus elymi]
MSVATAAGSLPGMRRLGFGQLLIAELRKLITTRMWIVLMIISAAAGAAGGGLYGAIVLLSAGGGSDLVLDKSSAIAMIYAGGNQFSRIIAIVAGAIAMGVEYRHKTLATTYLAEPRRSRVALAKGGITLGFGLSLGLASTVLGFLVAVIFVLIKGGSLQLGSASSWQALLMNIVTIALWAMIGYGLGILIRNMIVSITVAVAFAYIVEPLLATLFTANHWTVLSHQMPTNATNAMLGSGASSLMQAAGLGDGQSAITGFVVLVAWAVVPAAVGYLLVLRRDID